MADRSHKYLQHGVNGCVQRRSVEHSKTVTKQEKQSSVRQWTSRAKHEVKMTGGSERYTAKERASSRKQLVERDTRRVCLSKTEYQRSSTVKIVDKSCYTVYHTDQKVKRVNFDKSYKSGSTSRSIKNKY